jgi:hypothetical protein
VINVIKMMNKNQKEQECAMANEMTGDKVRKKERNLIHVVVDKCQKNNIL